MAEVVVHESDLAVLIGIVANLEGYLRLGVEDPTGRAHVLKHLARRASADLTRELALDDPDDADLAGRVNEINLRLRAQLTALNPDRG